MPIVNGKLMTDEEFRVHLKEDRDALGRTADERFAEMLRTRRVPRIKTDATFMRGKLNDNQFAGSAMSERVGEFRLAEARAAGINPKGKYRFSGMKDSEEDQDVWFDNKGDMIRAAKAKGMKLTIDGKVVVDHEQTEDFIDPAAPYTIADDLVDEAVTMKMGENPDLCDSPRDLMDLRESVKTDMVTKMNKEPE